MWRDRPFSAYIKEMLLKSAYCFNIKNVILYVYVNYLLRGDRFVKVLKTAGINFEHGKGVFIRTFLRRISLLMRLFYAQK